MAKLTLTDILGQYASSTQLNANFAAIETALENTLSRDGTTPNTMSADLDMNSNSLTNVNELNGISVGELGTLSGYVDYAQEWATKAEDTLVSVAAGGDGATDYSSLHWAAKASADAAQVATDLVATNQDTIDTAADLVATNDNVTYTAEWANKAEDSLISVAAGGDSVDDYSAKHFANKAAVSASIAANQNLYMDNLVKAIHPDQSKGLQELQKQGVYPVSFNQQWGGMGYSGLPDGSMGEVATGNIQFNSQNGVAQSAALTYIAQGFKVSQDTDVNSIWVNIYKVGNPTNNLELYIYSDTAGSPNAVITNGTATAQSGKLHTNNTDGEWVKFTFPTNPSLTADTQYHIVLKSSGAVDGSNYWLWKYHTTDKNYPHGHYAYGNATPTWTLVTTQECAFIVEPVTTILQSGLSGFDGAIHCYEGAPLDQSGAFYFANDDLNHKRGMIHYAGTGFTKDKTFHDSGLGTDNNRIVLRCNVTTGYAQVDLYENDGTKHTVTGATDISTGNHIISVGYRAEGDGSDYLNLYVDGASEGTPITAATITLDPQFTQGHTTIGGGFPLAPTWTQDLDMSVLPSADGLTWIGTATETNAMSVSDGILYQNGAGYASTDTGYYQETTTLVNSIGWVVETKFQVKNDENGTGNNGIYFQIADGTKSVFFNIHEYYAEAYNGAYTFIGQHDFTKATTFKVVGKSSNIYAYINGALIFDGTGFNTNNSASNVISFGDNDNGAGDNSTVEWHYVKYYEGAHLPEYSDVQISEMAHWNDDKSSLLSTIYNAGSIQSVKTLAGMNENYVKTKKQVIEVKGITSSPTTASTSYVPINDLNLFCFGEKIKMNYQGITENTLLSAKTWQEKMLDGVMLEAGLENYTYTNVANYEMNMASSNKKEVDAGLHYGYARWKTDTGTSSYLLTNRLLCVEAE